MTTPNTRSAAYTDAYRKATAEYGAKARLATAKHAERARVESAARAELARARAVPAPKRPRAVSAREQMLRAMDASDPKEERERAHEQTQAARALANRHENLLKLCTELEENLKARDTAINLIAKLTEEIKKAHEALAATKK